MYSKSRYIYIVYKPLEKERKKEELITRDLVPKLTKALAQNKVELQKLHVKWKIKSLNF